MSIKKMRNEIQGLPTLPNITPANDTEFAGKTSAQKHNYLYTLLKKVVRRQRKQERLLEELETLVLEMKATTDRIKKR